MPHIAHLAILNFTIQCFQVDITLPRMRLPSLRILDLLRLASDEIALETCLQRLPTLSVSLQQVSAKLKYLAWKFLNCQEQAYDVLTFVHLQLI